MREIVNLQIGQCGNQVGEKFWKSIIVEHGLDCQGNNDKASSLQLQKADVFFNKRSEGRFAPRALLVDTEPSSVESVMAGTLRGLFKPHSAVVSESGAGSNWAKGYLLLGSELLDAVMDVVRKEVEECDSLQGFQCCHSIGGGTGSGFGSLLLKNLRDMYSDRIVSTFTVFPSADVSNTVVEPYNAVHSIPKLIDNADAVHVLDNKALAEISKDVLKLKNSTFEDYNNLISDSMAGSTCSLRFPGQLNSDLRKLCVNLTPFPRLHFFVSSTAPLVPAGSEFSLTAASLTGQMFNQKHLMCRRGGSNSGRYLTASVIFRGKISTRDVDEQIRQIQEKESSNFVEWIPNNIKQSICNVPAPGKDISATFLGNTTGTQVLFQDLVTQFSVMLRRRAFLHWYTTEGLEEDDFYEAENNLIDLVDSYRQYEHGLPTTEDDSYSDNDENFN